MEQQYTNQMYYEEDEIDLKQLMIAVLRKWRVIILCAVIFAVLGGSYKGITGFMKLQDAEYMAEQEETIGEANEQYETQKELYQTQLKSLESEVETRNSYRDRSIYMNIDPYNEYRETVTYFVETDYQIMPGMDYQNINRATSILNAYVRQVQDFSIFGKAVNMVSDDCSVTDLRELVQVQQDNGNFMFTVTIVGPDEEIPSALMDTVRNTVNDSTEEIRRTIGEHRIREVSFTSGYCVDNGLANVKASFEDNITKLHDAMAKKQKALDDLKKPSGEVLTRKGAIKQAVKFAIIGAVGGGLLIALWVCVLFLLGDRMPDEKTLNERYGIRIIGTCRDERKKSLFTFVDEWIDLLEGIQKSDYNKEIAYRLAAADLDSMPSDGLKILVVGTISEEALHETYMKLLQYAEQKNYTLIEGGNMAEDPVAIRKLAEADAVLFIENRENTKGSRFIKTLELIKKQKKEVVGLFSILK